MSDMPSISIVTICRDNLEDLLRTCRSVDAQSHPPHEHIVVDGSSGEGIRRWLAESLQPAYRRSVSEPDEGISDAFNKGIVMSTGDVLVMLNSGDELYDETVLSRVSEAFLEDPSIQWLHGSMKLKRGGRWVVIGKPFERGKLYRGMRATFHPTMYVRRALHERHGLYDKGLRLAMDYDFLCRICDEKSAFIKEPLASFDPTGVSTENYMQGVEEAYRCHRRHHGFSLSQEVWKRRQLFLHTVLESGFGRWLYALKVRLGFANA
jgi:glycosyltransferase involved in cell wall biosynthesis